MLYATIMAGGAGTRFWPESRKLTPKQLLNLAGDRSMIQSTVDRLSGLCESKNVLIVTNQVLVDSISKQLPDVPRESIIGEPAKVRMMFFRPRSSKRPTWSSKIRLEL